MHSSKTTFLAFCLAITLPLTVFSQSLTWEIKPLALDTNEGVAIADFDGDGKLDVSAGRNWYHNPDFVARPLRNFGDVNGYAESNGDFVYDVDKDGRPDGKWIFQYKNGNPKQEFEWEDGSLTGKWTEWFENGQESIKGEVEDGKATGKWTEWFANGEKSFEGTRKRAIVKEKWTIKHERVRKSLEIQE